MSAGCQPPAVDIQNLSGEITGGVGCEKDDGAGQVGGLAGTPHRNSREKTFSSRGTGEYVLGHRRSDTPRSDRVDSDTALGPFDRERPRQLIHAAFGCAVRSELRQ